MSPEEVAEVFPWAAYYRDAYYCEDVLAVFRNKKAAEIAVKLYASNCHDDEEVTLERTADIHLDLLVKASYDAEAPGESE